MSEKELSAKGQPDSPRATKDGRCVWQGKFYNEGDCTVQEDFYAFVCHDSRWVYQGPAPCPSSENETK
jgi:hypothetical protein